MAVIRLIIIIFMGIFLLTSLVSWQSGMHYIEKTEFCEFCHEAKYVLYNEPGDSLDYAHNTHNVSCIDCHKGIAHKPVHESAEEDIDDDMEIQF